MIRINNRNNFLLKGIPEYHPSSLKYDKYWTEQTKRIIEGFWSIDHKDIKINTDHPDTTIKDNWRWMPPNLYFYVNFCTILHKKEGLAKSAPEVKMRPYLRDIEWEFFYNIIECRGFSGFEDDDKYTCLYINQEFDFEDIHPSAYDSKGNLKEFISPREYLRKLHNKPLGRPLYFNPVKDLFILGSRGFGKTYTVGNGILLHELTTDGRRLFDKKDPIPLVTVIAGAANSTYSANLLAKVEMSMNNFPGGWKQGTSEEVSPPFFKKMTGSLASGKTWKHEYEKKIGGSWKKKGSGSGIKHIVFTIERPQAAAGGRYTTIVVDEVGLLGNVMEIHGSNDAALTKNGVRFGSVIYTGTGGSIEKIVESEMIFRDPESYNCLSFTDTWENSGKIGWFVPAIYTDNRFKDDNGNTDESTAVKFFEAKREQKRKAKTSKALDLEMMNFPLKPSEMFLNTGSNNYPVADLKSVLSNLLSDPNLHRLSEKGRFSISEEGEIVFQNDKDAKPITEFPLTGMSDTTGAVEMWERPKYDNDNKIPYGRYIAALDPVDDDNEKDGIIRSLQSFWILDTFTDRMVLEYSARTRLAKDFYEQVRRALIYFNATLLYENQKKGLFAYFDNLSSLYLLADTPDMLRDIDMQKIKGTGNLSKGVYATDRINVWAREELLLEWLLTPAYDKPEGVFTYHTIRSIGLLYELIKYNGEINCDRISSLGILMIYRKSLEKYKADLKEEIKRKADDPFWDRLYEGNDDWDDFNGLDYSF